MPALVTLDKDGPLGPAGTQVWVDDPADKATPAKKAAPAKQSVAAKNAPDDK